MAPVSAPAARPTPTVETTPAVRLEKRPSAPLVAEPQAPEPPEELGELGELGELEELEELEAPDAPAPVEPSAPPRQGLSAAALALVLVAVLALGGAGVAFVKAHQLRSTDSARNAALVDTSVTNEVVGQVSVALNRIFSYDYTNPKPTQDAAAALLTGDAAGQYKTIFDALQSKASGQQLTLKAKSVIGGVSSLTGDSARLLIFLDQSSTRATDSSTSTAAAQLSVQAVKQGGIWKISEMRPL